MSDALIDPAVAFPELFASLAEVAPHIDFKAIADATPRAPLDDVRARFLTNPPVGARELDAFVRHWFSEPSPRATSSAPERCDHGVPLRSHIEALWPKLTRTAAVKEHSSLIALPHRYLVPGGMFRENYYWDSYFTLLGLDAEQAALKQECIENFAWLIDQLGFIPNGTRSYYLSRSQPPMFFAMVALLDRENPQRAFARYLPQLIKEHGHWLRGEARLDRPGADHAVVRLPDGSLLNRYWDDSDRPRTESYGRDKALAAACTTRDARDLYREIRSGCATGWDFSSRWLADRATMATIETTSIVPVDLNSLLYGLERAIEAGARECGQTACATEYAARAGARCAAMNKYLWNEDTGLFDDFDWRRNALRNAITPAALVPLFIELANPDQARRIAYIARRFLIQPGGLITSLHYTGQQWDAPNGWPPLQWIAVEGLRKYGLDAIAKDLATRWVLMVSDVLNDTGRLFEKYDVMRRTAGAGGEYPVQDGFGWTNGVTAALLDAYPDLAEITELVHMGGGSAQAL